MDQILVAMDRSPHSRAAARLAATIAAAHGARLVLYHAVSALEHLMLSKSLEQIYVLDSCAEWGDRLDEMKANIVAETASLGTFEIETLVEATNATNGILRNSRIQKTSMIVLGGHGTDAESSFPFGSVSARVARDANVPVLIVRGDHSRRFPASGLFANPMVAVDYSRFSEPAVRLAASLTAKSRQIELIHVYFAPDLEKEDGLADALASARARELERLQSFSASLDIAPVAVRGRVEGGRIARQLLKYVDESATDIVIIGAHGRSEDIAILGTAADRIIRRSAAPVLVLPDAMLDAG